MVANHGAEKEFECDEHNLIPGCGGKFASVLHLKKHQLTCGTKEKQHICQICEEGYMKKKKLGSSHEGNTHSRKGQVAMQLVWENLPI